jgi:hypothetical protein
MKKNLTLSVLQLNSYLEEPWYKKILNSFLMQNFKYPNLTAGSTEETITPPEILEIYNQCDKRRFDWNKMIDQSFRQYCNNNLSQGIDKNTYEEALYFYLTNNLIKETPSEIETEDQTGEFAAYI